MKYTITPIIFFCLLLMVFGCKNDTPQEKSADPVTEKNDEKVAGTNPLPKSTVTLVTFYDFNAQRSYMDYRRIKIKSEGGDPVRDAVNAFLRQNRIGPDLTRFKLDQIMVEDGVSIFKISGLSKLKDNEYKPLFKTALDSTIIYNYPNKPFKVVVNDEEI